MLPVGVVFRDGILDRPGFVGFLRPMPALLRKFRILVMGAGVMLLAGGLAAAPRYATIDEAIARGDLEDVRAHVALDAGIVNRAGARGLPLHQAISRNRGEIALFLLESGADADAKDRTRRTPLHLAVERGNVPLVTNLLKRKARPDERDAMGWTPLHHAAAKDQVAVARALLAGGVTAGTLSEQGGTPLHEAAASAGAEMVKLLLEAGVDSAVVSKTGVTALDIAREFKNEAAITALTAGGAK
jgi:ankyrin repeat protein